MGNVLGQEFVISWLIVTVIIYLICQVIMYFVINKILKIRYRPWEFFLDLFVMGSAYPSTPSIIKEPVKSIAIESVFLLQAFLSVAISLFGGYFVTKAIF